MSEQEKDGLRDCLFSREDMTLRNIKFCRGDRKLISAPEFRAQVWSSEDQKRHGNVAATSDAPHSGIAPVDVRAFVAGLG